MIQDADLEYSPEEYPALIELICAGRADVVYGSRFLGRHRVFLFTHYMGNKLLTLMTGGTTHRASHICSAKAFSEAFIARLPTC